MTRAVRLEPNREPPPVTTVRRRIFAAAFLGAVVVGALAGILAPGGGS